LCIYVGKEKVVDVYGRTPSYNKEEGITYNSDTTTNIMSCGKMIASILMAIMKDKKLLNYEDKISVHWPEFAKAGKEHLTIQDLMRHEAGLERLNQSIPIEWTLTENIKQNKIGEVIEGTEFY
jgi:CubicO group peptidase (beta-lactamase class C family)